MFMSQQQGNIKRYVKDMEILPENDKTLVQNKCKKKNNQIFGFFFLQMATALNNPVPCYICENQPARFHCNTCGDALCPTCKVYHLKSRASRHHDIVPFAKKLNPKNLIGLLCHTHKTDGPEYWCDTCSVPICGRCIIKDHKGHQFSSITAILSEKRDAMLEEMKALRDHTVNKWEEVLKQAQTIKSDFLHNFDEIDEELADRAKVMHKQVDEILEQSKQCLHKFKVDGLEKLQDQEKYLEDKLSQLKDDVQKYKGQLSDGDPLALLQYKEGQIQSQENKNPPSLITATLPVFTEGQDDTRSMEKIFGELSSQAIQQKSTDVTSQKSIARPAYTISAEASVSGRTKTSLSKSKKAKKSKANKSSTNTSATQLSLIPNPPILSQFDVDARVPFITCVEDGLAWVMTRHKKMHLMDRNGSVKDTMVAGFGITDMSLATNGDILLSDYIGSSVMSVSIKHKAISTLFRTNMKPYALCCLHSNDIVVAFRDDSQVTVFGKDGKIREKFDHIKFSNPRGVAVNKVNRDIYICHDELHNCGNSPRKVIAIGTDVRVRFEYKRQGDIDVCFYLNDICTNQIGHILISEYFPNRVHILDQEGQLIKQYVVRMALRQIPIRSYTIDVDYKGYLWVGGKGRVRVARYLQY